MSKNRYGKYGSCLGIKSSFVGQDDIYRNSGSKLSLRTHLELLELEVERFTLDTQTGIHTTAILTKSGH